MNLRCFARVSVSGLSLSALLSFGEAANASEPREASAGQADAPSALSDPYPWSLAARAFVAPSAGMGGMGLGVDVAYSVIPLIAVGAQYVAFMVDQGADPHYCERCIRSGSSTFAFGELRVWAHGWATPYARLGAGMSHLLGQREALEEGYTENNLSSLAELGVDLHYRMASLRLFAFDHAFAESKLNADSFQGGGAQLGVRF